jgi:hypothetical protein
MLSCVLDFFLSRNLRESGTFVTGEYTIWNDIYNRRINDEIVIYGASRAIYFNSEIIGDSLNRSCYNLGINGLAFWHIYLRHRELLKFNKTPKYIIISIDDFSLVKGKNLYQQDQFLPYMYGNANYRKYLRDVNSFSFFDYYIPLIRYYGRRKAIQQAIECSYSKKSAKIRVNKGFVAWDLDWNADFETAKSYMNGLEIKNDSTSISLFNDFLKECSMTKIKVIFVNSPEYIDGQSFIKNREDVIKLYHDFSIKYDLLFLDYSKDEMCLHKEYFFNAQHLNKTGADQFNKKLIRDLRNTSSKTGIYLTPDKKAGSND